MKKYLLLIIMLFCLVACSVDDQELENSNLNLQELNATYISDGCSVTTFDYGTFGKIEVRNDRHSLYISIFATGENTLSASSLHIADNYAGFPTIGKGNLQPAKMEHQVSFGPGTKEHSFHFPLSDFNETMVIASYTTFNGNENIWAGDNAVRQGNWAYFNNKINEHPINAGPDSSTTITLSEAIALPSWDEVRKLYAHQLAPGVDRTSGTYNPSIWEMIHYYNTLEGDSKLGDFSTTYTLGTGECTDSVILTVKVVEDVESM